MPFLIAHSLQAQPKEVAIEKGDFILGRDGNPQISDLFARDSKVSRRHAKIVTKQDAHFIEDLGSRNGTQINGQTITQPTQLRNRDRIRICSVELVFQLSAGTSKSSRAPTSDDGGIDSQLAQSSILARADVVLPSDRQTASAEPEYRQFFALLEMLRNLGADLEIENVLQKLLDGLFEVFPTAGRALVGLCEHDASNIVTRASRIREEIRSAPVAVSQTIVKQVLSGGQAILCTDATSDSRFSGSQSILAADVRSFMCAPMRDAEGNTWGMIQLDAMSGVEFFSEADLQVLASIAPQAGIAVKYTQLHQRELAQQALIRDLEVARRVQQSLLPMTTPEIDGYRFASHYEAANDVGGDYYDYVPLRDGRLAIIVADVAGKGVAAALLMARISGELKAYLLSEDSPRRAVDRLNRSLTDESGAVRFVTLVLVVLDPGSSNIEVVNAGHVAPIRRRSDGHVQTLGENEMGMPMGIDGDQPYGVHHDQLEPNEMILLVTDGVTEAQNSANKLYGFQRMTAQFGRVSPSAPDAVSEMLADIAAFVAGEAQSDDTCLICIQRELEGTNKE